MTMMSLLAGMSSAGFGPTPTIDASAQGQSSQSSSVSASITTTKVDNIIVAIVCIEGTPVTSSGITGVTASGLTFTKYTSNFYTSTLNPTYKVLQEVWYATASSILTAVSVTAATVLTDDSTIVLMGVNGCNLSAPFDTGTSMPINNTFASGSTTKTVSGINTLSTNPLIISSWYSNSPNGINTLDTTNGYTFLQFATNNGAVLYMYNYITYKSITGAAQSGATHSGAATTSTDVWGCTVFAMTG